MGYRSKALSLGDACSYGLLLCFWFTRLWNYLVTPDVRSGTGLSDLRSAQAAQSPTGPAKTLRSNSKIALADKRRRVMGSNRGAGLERVSIWWRAPERVNQRLAWQAM